MFYFAALFLCLVFSVASGEKYSAQVMSIEKCPSSAPIGLDNIDYQMRLEGNLFFLKGTLKKMVNNKYSFMGTVSMNNGFTDVQYMQANGNLCDAVSKMAGKALDRVRASIKPPITDECEVPPGDYVLENYKVDEDEVDCPIPTTGNFSSKIQLFDEAGTEIVCVIAKYFVYEH